MSDDHDHEAEAYEYDDEFDLAPTPERSPLRLGPGVYDISIADYIADPCELPSLRSSDIQRLLRYRPAHVKALHPRLCEPSQVDWAVRKATKRMELGSVIHALVLGKGSQFCVIDPAQFMVKGKKGDPPRPGKTLNTAEARAAVAEAKAAGLIVLDPKTNTIAERAASQLRTKLSEEFAEYGGWPFSEVEQTLIWTEQTAHGPVMCRTRPDIVALVHALVVDIKSSAAGLDQSSIDRTLSGESGALFVQAAFQRRGVIALHPEIADHVTYRHAWIETEPPYLPRITTPGTVKMVTADRRITRAIEAFAECVAANAWPTWERTISEGTGWLDKEWTDEEDGEIET